MRTNDEFSGARLGLLLAFVVSPMLYVAVMAALAVFL